VETQQVNKQAGTQRDSGDGPADGKLVEETISQEWVFRGKLLHVRRDLVRLPDGNTAVREYIVHPGAVMIIPITESGEVVLERQFRYPLRREMIELPAGKVDPGESPLATGRRELLEETGYTAAEWQYVATIHLAIGYSNERIDFYMARGLKQEGARLDHGEFLDVFTLPVAEALEWLRQGRITDSKTVAGLLWLDKIQSGQWKTEGNAPDWPTG
jgi:ADP-ribose pyrophosphatase